VESVAGVSTEAWPVVHDVLDSIGLPYFRLMFVCLKALTPGHGVTNTDALQQIHCFDLHAWKV